MRYRELVDQVVAGGSADTCPVAFWAHQPIADQEADSLAAATLAFQQRYDCDLVKITPASTFQLRDYGLTDAWRGDPLGRREIGPGIITSPDDWGRLPALDPGSGFVSQHLRCAAVVRERLPDEVPVLQTVFNPIFQAAALGGEVFADHLRDHPDAVMEGLAVITANTVALVGALADAGVDGVYLVAQHARLGAMSVADYERLALGSDRACLEAARAMPLNLMHLHGEGVFARLAMALPVDVVHFAEDPGSPAAEELLVEGGCAVSTGPGQDGLLRTGTAEQAALEAEEVLVRLKGPRFLLGAGCVLALDTPEANVKAVIAAARTPRPDRA